VSVRLGWGKWCDVSGDCGDAGHAVLAFRTEVRQDGCRDHPLRVRSGGR
jgi:hypothetical protein